MSGRILLTLVLLVVRAELGALLANPRATSLSELHQAATQLPRTGIEVEVNSVVLKCAPEENRMVLHDPSGTYEVEMELDGTPLRAGQSIVITGLGFPALKGNVLQVIGEIVNNDGVHPPIERSGEVYLHAGDTTLTVDWFNAKGEHKLMLEYSGPGIPRGTVARARSDNPGENGTGILLSELHYTCSTGVWNRVPSFSKLPIASSGLTSDIDLKVRVQDEYVGLRFKGRIQFQKAGIYHFYSTSDDGSILRLGEVNARVVGEGRWPSPKPISIGQDMSGVSESDLAWGKVAGRIKQPVRRGPGGEATLSSGLASMEVEFDGIFPLELTAVDQPLVEITGLVQTTRTLDNTRVAGRIVVSDTNHIRFPPDSLAPSQAEAALLQTISEIKRLSRKEASEGISVRIRGVVTHRWQEDGTFLLQDGTSAIYVSSPPDSVNAPEVGDFLQVIGHSSFGFAPNVTSQKVIYLGKGVFPEPVKANWDQLMNGSLDARYIELEGIVTRLMESPRGLSLLLSRGTIDLHCPELETVELKNSERALIRVKGCLLPVRDPTTGVVEPGRINLVNARLSIVQPMPESEFDSPQKSIEDLLKFDADASPFQRVKIKGQIIFAEEDWGIIAQGGKGLRCKWKPKSGLQSGDMIEIVGFPEWGGTSPWLRECVFRKMGRKPLDLPKPLRGNDMQLRVNDGQRIEVEAVVLSVSRNTDSQWIEAVAESQRFIARLNGRDGSISAVREGSIIQIAGVLVGMGRSVTGAGFESVEVLLASAGDVKVLADPPLLTVRRVMMISAFLLGILTVAVTWIYVLRRQVKQRTAQLAAEIQARERIDHQRAIEEEKSRVANDLHDELGAGLTEIALLGALARQENLDAHRRKDCLDQVLSTASTLVDSLDEIVWAINPRHDTVGSIAGYYSTYAQRFLSLASIACRLNVHTPDEAMRLDSRARHGLFLALKEALNNIVKHSRATEVHLTINADERSILVRLEDNGRGANDESSSPAEHGLSGMRGRMSELGGSFSFQGRPGSGVCVEFRLPCLEYGL